MVSVYCGNVFTCESVVKVRTHFLHFDICVVSSRSNVMSHMERPAWPSLYCLLLKLKSVSSSYSPPVLPPSQFEQCQQFSLSAWTASSANCTVSEFLTVRLNCWTVSAVRTVRLNCLLLKLNSVISSYCPPVLPPSQVEECQQFPLSAWTASSASCTVSAVLTVSLNCLLLNLNSVSSSYCPPELPPPQLEQCQQFLLSAWTASPQVEQSQQFLLSAWTASSSTWTVSAFLTVRLYCLLLKLKCQQFLPSAWTASSSSRTVSAVLTVRLNCLLLKLNSVSSSYCPPELLPPQVEQCQQFLLSAWTASFSSWTVSAVLTARVRRVTFSRLFNTHLVSWNVSSSLRHLKIIQINTPYSAVQTPSVKIMLYRRSSDMCHGSVLTLQQMVILKYKLFTNEYSYFVVRTLYMPACLCVYMCVCVCVCVCMYVLVCMYVISADTGRNTLSRMFNKLQIKAEIFNNSTFPFVSVCCLGAFAKH